MVLGKLDIHVQYEIIKSAHPCFGFIKMLISVFFFPVQTLWKNPEYLLLGKISAKCGRCKQWCILQQLEVMHYISIHTHTQHTH